MISPDKPNISWNPKISFESNDLGLVMNLIDIKKIKYRVLFAKTKFGWTMEMLFGEIVILANFAALCW